MVRFHPDLAAGRFLPPIPFGPRVTPLMNRAKPRARAVPPDMIVEDRAAPGFEGAPPVPVRVYRQRTAGAHAPALLWIHGGGMVSGVPLMDERTNIDFARTLGMVVVSVDYRLAPGARSPAQVQDCYSALRWLHENAEHYGIDTDRIAVGGASAGGGLAAGLVLLAHDRGELPIAFQLLVYPMLDDRTVLRDDHRVHGVRAWSKKSNRYGWTAYLGRPPGSDGVSPYAAPARRLDLSGLPSAWIGVGTFDLFHDEDVEYARRLREADVPCELDVIEGAFHGFDAIMPKADVSKEFWRKQATALQSTLRPDAPALIWD